MPRKSQRFALSLAVLLGLGLAPALRGQTETEAVMSERALTGHGEVVYHAVVLADGKTALSCSFDRTVRKWEIATGRELTNYPVSAVNDIALLPGGTHALLAQGIGLFSGRVTHFQLSDGDDTVSWKCHEMGVVDIEVVPGGKLAVSASSDGTAIVWDLQSREPVHTITAWTQGVDDGLPAGIDRQGTGICVAASPDGKHLAIGTTRNHHITVWDLQNGQRVHQWKSEHGEVSSIHYSPDGELLLTTTLNGRNTGMQLRDAQTGRVERAWDAGYMHNACFSPDGKRFLTAGWQTGVKLWAINRKAPLADFVGHEGWVQNVAFSPDGKTALSCGYDKTVRVWSVPDVTAAESGDAGNREE